MHQFLGNPDFEQTWAILGLHKPFLVHTDSPPPKKNDSITFHHEWSLNSYKKSEKSNRLVPWKH